MRNTYLTRARLHLVVSVTVVAAMVVAGLALPTADAAGPPYSGPSTQATGPAFFGPAPNPFPYCENPTYFDPFPENVNPIGRIDVTGSPNASVTTNGVTMTFELTAEGDVGGQYPGFFPEGGDGSPGDQPKGVEMASDDQAIITLSQPLFYTQWVFTDVDRANEGFFVTPSWSDPNNPSQVAVFGGDANFDFTGTTTTQAAFNDTDTVAQDSEAIEGRVQVDLLGASTGISLVRDTGSGQSGFAIGGGCEPIGVAKEVTSGPTWNGSSFDVTYTIRVRNNLPSAATISADITAALAAAASGTTTGAPTGIDLQSVSLSDLLTDPAFSSVTVLSNVNTSGNVATNAGYNGDSDVDLLAAGETIPPESEEEFVVSVQYIPEVTGPVGPDCIVTYELLNQATVDGVADGVDVVDLSDDGPDPDPGVGNGNAGVNDPTPVRFDCPPTADSPALDIVKTVVEGPAGTCPSFDAGADGEGPALDVQIGDTVTYCISVRNTSAVDATNVVISDPQAPGSFDGAVGDLTVGADATRSFDLVVDATTPTRNVASATADDPAGGQLPPVSDPANINPDTAPPGTPAISLSKTVLAGSNADCADAVEGADEFVLGTVGDAITWCFVVTNTGDVALTNVLFTDEPAGIADADVLDGAGQVLAVGESVSFREPGTIAAGGVDNVASVTGQASDPDGTPVPGVPTVTDENDAAINEAALTLDKTVAAGANADCATAVELVTVNVGADVTYCFTITNTGGVTVRVTQVDDVTLGATVAIPAGDQDLAPGASVQVAYSTTATGDLVNTAQVTGVPIDDTTGDPFPDAEPLQPQDPAEVDTVSADLSIEKTNNGVQITGLGNLIPYVLTITNDGPDAAVNVVVVDTLPTGLTVSAAPSTAGWSCSESGQEMTCTKATPLAPGQSETLEYTVFVEVTAPQNQSLVNTAVVTSDTPDPDPTNNEDTETTEVVPARSPGLPVVPLEIVPITNPPVNPLAPGPPVSPTDPVQPPLAVTGGAFSRWLILVSAAMAGTGGVLFVAGRRASDR